jgi:hypothetical protein
VIGRQGVKDLADPQEQPRKLSLRGMVRGSSVADARAKLDALKIALAAKAIQLTFADQPTRFVTGRLDSFTAPPLTGSLVHGAMPVDATFMCGDPYFYDIALTAGIIRTNSAIRANDLTNAAWTKTGTGTATQNAVGIDGSANSATTVADTDAAAFTRWSQSFPIAADGATHSVAVLIAKDAVTSRFPQLKATISGGTAVTRGVTLNTQTGASAVNSAIGTSTHRVVDEGAFWRLEITITNNSTAGNVTLTYEIYPATSTVIGVDSAAAQGSDVVGFADVQLNTASTGPIIVTAGTALTRAWLPAAVGSGVLRPIIRITGASVNPVITLYNKWSVAVATILLTITTVGGDVLVIDMDAKTIKLNGVSQIATLTAGDFFSIDPADQANFGGNGPTIGSTSGVLSVDYRRAWR